MEVNSSQFTPTTAAGPLVRSAERPQSPARPSRPAQADLVTSALAFFDIFRHPLTALEAWRWQRRLDGRESGQGLGQEAASGSATSWNQGGTQAWTSGFGAFFERFSRQPDGPGLGYRGLSSDGRTDVRLRWHRYRLAERKYRRACRFAAAARLLPSVRLVAVGNSLAWSSSEEGSDIDLFVVTAPGTLWATRFILGSALILLGLRPTPTRQKDRLCLSFLVSQDRLDLADLRFGPEDVYFTFWLAGLVPVYDAGGMMERLWAANRTLLAGLPRSFPRRTAARRRVEPRPAGRLMAAGLMPLLRLTEIPSRWLQKLCFPRTIRQMANRDTRVVIDDRTLKFHVSDRRDRFAQEYRQRLAEL